MTEPLFFCATLAAGDEITLTGDEAHHVAVQRLRRGDALALFDGHGQVVRGVIEAIGRKDIRVKARERHREPPPRPRLELYSAVPKGERLAVLLDMATQLGMARFTPLRWERSVTDPKPQARERWQRIFLEACKQSRRLHLPEIGPATEVVEAATHCRVAQVPLLVAHPIGDTYIADAFAGNTPDRIALFVGPEGGLTDDEVEMLGMLDARFVRLGDAILRIETAAVALLALVGAATRGGIAQAKD